MLLFELPLLVDVLPLTSIPPEEVVVVPPNVANAPVTVDTVLVTFVPTLAEVEPDTAPALPAQGLLPGGAAAFTDATQASYPPRS